MADNPTYAQLLDDDILYKRLVGTRDRLKDVYEELGIQPYLQADEEYLAALQCTQCSIWASRKQFVIEAGLPVCSFCQDMDLLRF